jgi:hypothetical protein
MPGDTRDYAAVATPVTSAQVAKAWVRPDRRFAAVSWSRRRGKYVGDLVMSGKEALNLPRRLEPLHDPLVVGSLMGVFGPVIEALVLRRSRAFGQVPGRNKLKAGSRLLVSSSPEIKFNLSCCGAL